uniref:Uncharacterized protein n=1 Tax=Catagonus wagneri TaxID=51154 RepID=A0A8C3XB38_9CETA
MQRRILNPLSEARDRTHNLMVLSPCLRSRAHAYARAFFPGSGCSYLEKVVADVVDSRVTVDEYQASLQEFIDSEDTAQALRDVKQCFLQQSEETLANFLAHKTTYPSTWQHTGHLPTS